MLLQSPGIGPVQGQSLSLTPAMRRQLELLTLDAGALAQHLAQLFGARDDLLLIPSQAHSIERLFPARQAPRLAEGGNGIAAEIAVAPADALHAHVERQIGLIFPAPRERQLAQLLAGHLAPTGWLDTPLDEINGAGAAELLAVLTRLQQGIEPAGLFARDLAECLRLQLEDAGQPDPLTGLVLANLGLLAGGELDRLAALAGVETAQIAAVLRRIRACDPKPGLQFGSDPLPLPEPDLLISRAASGWKVRLNPRLSSELRVLHPEGERAAAEFRALTGFRDATLLRAGRWLAEDQSGWLAEGPAALRPMTRRRMAAGLGLHETTIGRALRHRLVQTPRGMFVIDRLFGAPSARRRPGSGTGPGDGAAGTAPQAVLIRLAAMIRAEPPAAPLGDAALAGMLAAEGIPMARRTVARYRGLLGIGARHLRRRE